MSHKGQKMLHERRVQAGLEAPTELDRANAHRKEQWMEPSPAAQKGWQESDRIRIERFFTLGLSDTHPWTVAEIKRYFDGFVSSEVPPTPSSPPPRGERGLALERRLYEEAKRGNCDNKDCSICRAIAAAVDAAALAQPPRAPEGTAPEGERATMLPITKAEAVEHIEILVEALAEARAAIREAKRLMAEGYRFDAAHPGLSQWFESPAVQAATTEGGPSPAAPKGQP